MILAEVTVLGRPRRRPEAEARVCSIDSSFNDLVPYLTSQNGNIEVQPRFKTLAVGFAIGIYKKTDRMNLKSILFEYPRVNGQLSPVTDLPIGVQGDFPALGSRLVVDNEELAVTIYPQVVDTAGYSQVRGLMVKLDALVKGVPPIL